MEKRYCEHCESKQKSIVKKTEKKFNIEGKEIKFKTEVLICENCKEEVYDVSLNQKLTEKALYEFNKMSSTPRVSEYQDMKIKLETQQMLIDELLKVPTESEVCEAILNFDRDTFDNVWYEDGHFYSNDGTVCYTGVDTDTKKTVIVCHWEFTPKITEKIAKFYRGVKK